MKWLLLSILLFPLITSAEEFNAGIVQGLWYSQEKVFADDSIRIYVAIRNNTGSDLSGTIEFFDGDTRIARKNVAALNGRIIESWADWTAQYGSHTLSANLTRIELHTIGSSTQEVAVTSALAEDTLFIDHDTDTDGIGNTDDTDDDGDGVTDAQEIEDGTDPLKKETLLPQDAKEEELSENTPQETYETDNAPEGLERFLAESPAQQVLANATHYITATKQELDSYRENRKEKQQLRTAQTASTTVNAEGFGEITRSEDINPESSRFDMSDFFTNAFTHIGTLLRAVYTLLLGLISFILSYPILVQVGLLLLLLFLLLKTAAKFGRRPKKPL